MASPYLIPMIYELIIFLIAISISFLMLKRYSERKNTVIRMIFLFTLMMTLSILTAAISRLLRLTEVWEIQPNQYLELLAVSVCFIAIANVFMLSFCLEVFYSTMEPERKKGILVIYSLVAMGFVIFALVTGLFEVDLTELIWGFLILISSIVLGFTAFASFKLAKKLEKPLDKRSTQIIGLGPINILLVFVMFLLDRMVGGNFSIFYYFGWAFVVSAALLLYIGVIRPEWFVKKYQ